MQSFNYILLFLVASSEVYNELAEVEKLNKQCFYNNNKSNDYVWWTHSELSLTLQLPLALK